MRNGGQRGQRVKITKRFQQNWDKLPKTLCKRACEKITLLQHQTAHPSLHVHQLHRSRVQVCAISATHRLLFERSGTELLLLDIGSHRCVDQAHLHARASGAIAFPVRGKQNKQKKRLAHLPVKRQHRARRRQ